MSIKKNINLICYGTTINDIIKSINKELNMKNKQEKKSLLDYLFGKKKDEKVNNLKNINTKKKDEKLNNLKNKIKNINTTKIGTKELFLLKLFLKKNDEKENNLKNKKKYINIEKIDESDMNMLYNIGIKELFLFKSNKINEEILKNVNNIYCAVDIPSIESTIIISNKKNIYPIPYTSKEINIKNQTDIYKLKNKFGEYIMDEKKTYIKKYWETKLNILDIKDKNVNIKNMNRIIDWKYCVNNGTNNKKLFGYNIGLFETKLIEICKNDSNENIVIISNPELIINLLKKINMIKYNEKNDIIENTSLWNIEITIDKEEIKYNIFKKIYPTEYNYKPLIYNQKNNKYEYTYNKHKFILFNSINLIPKTYLYYISYTLFMKKNQDKIKKIMNHIKNSNTEKINNMIENNKKFNFDKFK
jgi:hypothetical protein